MPESRHSVSPVYTFVIPVVLANAGGVTCSYFEQVQSNTGLAWTRDDILTKLGVSLDRAAQLLFPTAASERTSLREAAYIIGVGRWRDMQTVGVGVT